MTDETKDPSSGPPTGGPGGPAASGGGHSMKAAEPAPPAAASPASPAVAKPAPPAAAPSVVPAAAPGAAPAAAPVKKPPAAPPAPQIPRNPGAASRLAKAATIVADKEQEPLAGSADLGWNVLNVVMTIGAVALGIIALLSVGKAISALFGILGSAPQ